MNDMAFDVNEFINPQCEPSLEVKNDVEEVEIDQTEVQKVVVEELASEKAEIELKLSKLQAEKENQFNCLQAKINEIMAEVESLKKEKATKETLVTTLQQENNALKKINRQLEEKVADLQLHEIDLQERNPNALALLDRDVDLPDRFPGETRDHVLEVIQCAREQAEKEGRLRRAQLLEGVLLANEPNGNLAKKRIALEKFFKDNGNLVTGAVLEELKKCGIAYKNGEEYLLPAEILQRTY